MARDLDGGKLRLCPGGSGHSPSSCGNAARVEAYFTALNTIGVAGNVYRTPNSCCLDVPISAPRIGVVLRCAALLLWAEVLMRTRMNNQMPELHPSRWPCLCAMMNWRGAAVCCATRTVTRWMWMGMGTEAKSPPVSMVLSPRHDLVSCCGVLRY